MALTTEQLAEIGKGLPEFRDEWRNVLPLKEREDPGKSRVGAAVDAYQGLLWNVVAGVSDFLGGEKLSNLAYAYAQENYEEVSRYQRASISRGEVKFGDNFGKWLADTLIIDGLPTITIAAGTIAASVASGGTALPALFALGASTTYGLGESYGEAREELGKENINPAVVLAVAGINGALDVITPLKVARKFFKGGVVEFKEKALKELSRNGGLNHLSRFLREGTRGMRVEAFTEGLQEWNIIIGVNIQAGKENIFEVTPDQWRRIWDAVAAGGALGTTARGATAFVGRGNAKEIITAREAAQEQISSDLNSSIEPIKLEIKNLEAQAEFGGALLARAGGGREVSAKKASLENKIKDLEKEANKKRKKVSISYTVADIEKIVPPIEEEAVPTPEALQEELGTVEQRLTEAKAELETEVAKPRGRAPNRKAIRLKEEIASLEARKSEIATQLEETAPATEEAAAPITPPTDEQAPTTPITPGPEESAQAAAEQSYTPTGSEFFTQLDEQIAQLDDAIAKTEAQLAQPIEETSAFNKRRITTQLRKKLAEQKAERDRLLAMQRTPDQIAWSDVARRGPRPELTADQRLDKEEDLALREAERQNLDQQVAAQAEARAKAQADAEDAAAAQADAAAAQEAAAAQAEAQRIADEEAALGAATWADVAVPVTEGTEYGADPSVLADKASQVEALEELIAQQEGIVDVMVKSGITTDKADPKPYTIPELQEILQAIKANKKRLEKLQKKADQEAATQNKSLIGVIEPGSSITNADIARADVRSRIQQAKQDAWNVRRSKARDARLKAEEIKRQEVAQQGAERREEAAQRREQEQRTRINDERKAAADARAEERAVAEAERKRKAEDAKEQAEFEKRETNKTVAEAQASASETIAEFETRPLTISEMKTQMRVRGNKIGDADRIGASEAKAEYLDTVRKGINEIDSARVAAATAEKAKAATTPKAASVATEKKPDTKPTAPVTDEALQVEALEERIAQLKEEIASLPTTEKKPDTTPSQADVTPPVPDAETDRETFETVDGVTMTRDYTFSTEDVGMSKSEFNTFNTEGKGVVPDYYIDIMAEKRLAGDSFNKYEENALTWPGVSEKVAQAEGRRREEAAETAPDRVAATQAAKPKGKVGEGVKAGVAAEPDTRKKKKPVKKGQSTFKRFSQSRDGKSWTAKIAGASAKITIDEVGEYHTTYDGRSDPLPLNSLLAAKISLLENHGTTKEKKKIPGRKPAGTKRKTTSGATVEFKREKKKKKYAEDTENSAGVPVRIDYDPTLDKEKPYIVMVRGEPFKRYAKRDRARYVANRVTDKDVEKQLIAIQEDRLKEQAGVERGKARAAAAMQRGKESMPTRARVVLTPTKKALATMPLPTLNDKKGIKNPNVKIDSELEREVIEEATDLDGNSITVSYEERDLTSPDAQKSTSFRKSEVSISRFNTFTPFMASTKEEAQAISASIYANPEIFRVFLANEISTRADLDPKIVSMGVINDQEALKMQQSYQRRVDKLLSGERARKRLTDEQQNDIVKWRKKIKDLATNEGRNYKSTVIPGATQADFDESLQRWVDFLDDKGKDTGPIRDFLDTKKKVDEEVAVAVVEDQNPDDTLYHITRTEDVESIIEDGIQRFGGARAATNWLDNSGARMGGGEVYSFDNRDEALKWAQKMEWEVYDSHDTGKISIVSHKRGEDWSVDENVGTEEPQGLSREEGVDPEDIIEAEVFVFGNMGDKFQAVAGATFKTERTITPGKAVSVEIRDNIDLFFETLAEDPESISTEFMEEMIDVYTDGGKDADYLMDKNGEFKSEFGREGLDQTPDGDWILKVSPELQYTWKFDQGPVLMEDIEPVETSLDEADVRSILETAHSTETLNDLKGIAKKGLAVGSSVEDADQKVYADGTFRIIFDGPVSGEQITRAFAPDYLTVKTSEVIPPSKIKRIEVDVDNLPGHVTAIDDKEYEARMEAEITKYLKDKEPNFNFEETTPTEWGDLFTKYPGLDRIFARNDEALLAGEAAKKSGKKIAEEINSSNYKSRLKDIFGEDVEIVERVTEDTPSEVAYNNPTEFLYHVTPTAFVAKIKKEGIKSSRDRGGLEYAPGVTDSIHVADNIQDARSFAKFLNSGIGKSGARWKADEVGAVSIIKVTNDGSQLYLDPNRGKTREDKKWLIRKESISPNDIVSVEPYEMYQADVARVGREVAEEGEISEAEFDRLFGYGIADEESALDRQYARERADRKKGKSIDKVSVDSILANENPADLHSKLTTPPSQNGYSVDEVKSLAANIKALNPDFNYNPKGKKEDIAASIMEWYVSPMEDAYTKADLTETKENDDVVESRGPSADVWFWGDENKILGEEEGWGPFKGVQVHKKNDPDYGVGTLTGRAFKDKGGVIRYAVRWERNVDPSLHHWETGPRTFGDTTRASELVLHDTGDPLPEARRMKGTTTFHSPGQAEKLVRSQVRSIFGKKAVSRFEEIKFINFVDSVTAKEMGASETAQAFVSRGTGQIYFISDRIPSDMGAKEMRGLIFHEMGVHFGRDVFSGSEWNSVLDELYKLGQNGDDIVNTAVARVMRNYGYKKADSGRPFDPAAKHINFHGRREFWEEVLAHVVEIKQPALDSPSRKGLLDKIKDAFRTFFNKVFGTDMNASNITLDDIVNLIGYSTWHSGILALERHGDSKNMSRLRDRKRKEFLDGSIMKEPVYHGTPSDWSAPLIEKTQLGLHVGTSIAAINISASKHFRDKPIQESEALAELADEVEAWKPGWEARISNRDLDKIAISWDPKLRLRTSDNLADAQGLFDSLGMQKEVGYTWFEKGANIRRGYINVQNPFIAGDLGNFSDPTSWFTHANRVLGGGVAYNSPESQEVVWEKISKLARSNARTRRSLLDESDIAGAFGLEAKFSRELRALLKEEGYDSIEYTNDAEDVGSKSWTLLDDNQYKSVDDLSFDSGTGIFSTKKVISQPNSSAIVESRRLERETAREVVKSRIGTARANSALKWMQRRIEPLMAVEGYTLLEAKRMLTKGKVGEWANTGRIVFDVLNEATPTEKKAIYKYFTTRNADPSKLPTRKVKFAEHRTVVRGARAGPTAPSVSIKEKVIETKKEIASMGERLVAAGLITDAQYAEWKNQYLPRVYMEHVMGGRDRIGIGGLRASSLTYTKHRKDHEKFLNDVISGRIDDPAFLAGRYLTMAGSDLAIIEYLSYIASDPGNNKWVLPGQIMTFRNMIGTAAYFKNLASDISTRANAGKRVDPARSAEMLELSSEMNAAADQVSVDMRGLNMDNYRKVPDSPRYGAMRELWVHKDIWNDINGLGITGNPTWGWLLKWSGRAQTTFKYTKVPMNIPTQVRNMISNAILMNVSGTNFLRIPGAVSKAMHDVSTNGKYMQLARKYGLETTTFAATELGQIDRELATVKAKGDSFEGMWARARIFFNDYGDVGGRAYQKTEVLFKVAKMIDLMENHGKKEVEAAKLANEALLDYGNVSQGIRMLRTLPLGSPFITFNAKVMAQMARNIKNHPFASLKYAALPYLLMEMFLSQNDDLDEGDWDALMDFLPDYMEKEFSTMVFPYKDENNRWQAWDVSFFLPWGAHVALAKNVAKGEFGDAIYKSIGMFTGPAEIPIALKLNKDPFTRQPIYNEFDPVHQRYQDMMMFVASYMIPPMLTPRNKAGDIITGGGPLIKTMMAADIIDGNVDRDGLPRYTLKDATLSWFGVSRQKLGPQDVETALYFKEREIRKIQQRAERMLSDPSLSREKRERLANEYREHMFKIIQEHRKWAESLKRFERLF